MGYVMICNYEADTRQVAYETEKSDLKSCSDGICGL